MTQQSTPQAQAMHRKMGFREYTGPKLSGPRNILEIGQPGYPEVFEKLSDPPYKLYVVGNAALLIEPSLAVVGARKATPYGLACARKFAGAAARRGIVIVSGGASGCDSEAHRAALNNKGKTIAFFGGGCDQVYPPSNFALFQEMIDSGGAVVSENEWSHPCLPYTFRNRNRLIASIAEATLIVEAGLPSGTFSTADFALEADRYVLSIPGCITSKTSAGSNRLIRQGAIPIIDGESFEDELFALYGILRQEEARDSSAKPQSTHALHDPLLEALCAQPMRMDDILDSIEAPKSSGLSRIAWIQLHLSELERDGLVARYPDGRYGPACI